MIKEYTLNETPVRTTNNYKINDITIKIDNIESTPYGNMEVLTSENEKLDIITNIEYNEPFKTKIGLSFEKYYKTKIVVKENKNVEEPVYIKNTFTNNNVFVNEVEIIFEKNSKASFIFELRNDEVNSKSLNYIKQVNHLEENSKGQITFVNLINDKSENFIAVENYVDNNSLIDYKFIDLGGKTKISNYYTKLQGYESKNTFNNIYLGNNDDIIDMNYHIEILGKKSMCNINAQGAISGNSKKNFKGTIDFIKGSEKSIGIENENCVILSDSAKSKSLPMLLCHEEDVQGAHGVSSGKIDEDKLFYIMSKGISKKDAEKLIVKANFNNIINEIENTRLRNEIIDIIER